MTAVRNATQNRTAADAAGADGAPGSRACPAWFLVGPTAAGKSEVAHLLAGRRGALVLSADAMAVYRGMDIGTAKPDAALRAAVCHRGIDLAEPADSFSAGAYLAQARMALAEASRRNQPVIVAGGSGLYVSALLRGLDDAAPADPARRAHWERVEREEGLAGLRAALERLDAEALRALSDPRNPRRLIRALERAEAGRGASRAWRAPLPVRLTGLQVDAEVLRARVALRARRMFEGGLLEEAGRLREGGRALSPTAAQAIGYAEAFAVLEGRLTIEQAIERAAARTWQLARRQMTWFRRQLPVSWIRVNADETCERLAERVARQWEEDGPTALSF